ncbi:MAG: hypothetical protein PVJ73_19145 [Acidobacteriota bacterium]|jgi:hypothetical protein|nr:hypothetical protein [Acidobacteriota bacterium]
MTFPHAGIRIDRIPAEEGGGFIFMVGMVALFLIGVPAMRPVVALAALGGILLAPLLHRLRR